MTSVNLNRIGLLMKAAIRLKMNEVACLWSFISYLWIVRKNLLISYFKTCSVLDIWMYNKYDYSPSTFHLFLNEKVPYFLQDFLHMSNLSLHNSCIWSFKQFFFLIQFSPICFPNTFYNNLSDPHSLFYWSGAWLIFLLCLSFKFFYICIILWTFFVLIYMLTPLTFELG